MFEKSLDGGKKLSNLVSAPPGDHHGLWIEPPGGPGLKFNCNEGGASISLDGGKEPGPTQDKPSPTGAYLPRSRFSPAFPTGIYGAPSREQLPNVGGSPSYDDEGRGSSGSGDWYPGRRRGEAASSSPIRATPKSS